MVLGFAILATASSGQEIQEKWRIRHDWAENHPGQMSEEAYNALTVDGANLLLGPFVYGFVALCIFVGVEAVLNGLNFFLRSRYKDTFQSPNDTMSQPVRE
ncbi:MAG: hypothetical protein R3C03_13755 [Pirellulaceae bacterium]